jgi:cytolysin (calcineurin-like family phosphatase)
MRLAYAQLVAAHVGVRGPATSALEMQDAARAARVGVAAHTVADLDHRLGRIELTIEEAAKRDRTTTALTAIAAARKTREVLAAQRQREGKTLADLKAERAALGATGRQIETEAAPIRYVAELLGVDADSERAIRWLILMIVLCCDTLAIALSAAASAWRTTNA